MSYLIQKEIPFLRRGERGEKERAVMRSGVVGEKGVDRVDKGQKSVGNAEKCVGAHFPLE